MTRVLALLEETRCARQWHRQRGNQIEAMAAAIRERALVDAIEALKDRTP